MTKERYFEMCEMLGNEPVEEEIPVEADDLPLELQEALQIYNTLQDNWDYMNGNYIGKNLNGFMDIMELYEVPKPDRRTMYELLLSIDRIRARKIRESKKASKKPA
ncbi:hypothetical protein UFOVP273_143 [uncultured Caudovirales phage]|uniref:Uncharacterized protein n=1 Tax=uncultured Caudovirales phage TaxID=2100421 RepID=A0A6J5LIX4_9CAUD|nr:hypothetical protein UFOVP273_143 [uncultured Caudovirales phage]